MRGAIAGAAVAVLLAACTTQAPDPPATSRDQPPGLRSARPTDATEPRSVEPGASAGPDAQATASEFARYSVVQVITDAAPLHQGPGHEYAAVEAWSSDPEVAPDGTLYRLSGGERLIIEGGPLTVDGTDWYLVRPAGLPERGSVIFNEGWVAVGDGEARYLQGPSPDASRCCFSAAAVGTATTQPVPAGPRCSTPSVCGRAFGWVAGVDDPHGVCAFRVLSESSGEVLVDEAIDGWTRGGDWWLEPDGARLLVETDCSWALHVGPA